MPGYGWVGIGELGQAGRQQPGVLSVAEQHRVVDGRAKIWAGADVSGPLFAPLRENRALRENTEGRELQ